MINEKIFVHDELLLNIYYMTSTPHKTLSNSIFNILFQLNIVFNSISILENDMACRYNELVKKNY